MVEALRFFVAFAAKKMRLAPQPVAALSRAQYLPRGRGVPAEELRSGDHSYVGEATSTESCRCAQAKRLLLSIRSALLAGALTAAGAEVKVWDGAYVPDPRPAESRTTLGVYIFPGWYRDKGRGDYPYYTQDEKSEWRAIARCPKPRALLGFYDDSLPEVNDWHIKWALEHGISFFAFDWYWNAGEHRLLRTLEQGFLKAKYQHLMKFCIHWCNHGSDWRPRGWYPMMGLSEFEVKGGAMKAQVTSGDPAFACMAGIDASRCKHAVIGMKLNQGQGAQLFWTTSTTPESGKTCTRFKTIPDNQFHEYVIDLSAVESWRGHVTRLRLDPNSSSPGSAVEVDYVRILERPGAEAAHSWEFDRDRSGRGLSKWGLDFSTSALVEMAEYLADNYLQLPNYLTIDGRPVLMIWDPKHLIEAHGGPSELSRAVAQMNAVLHKRGLRDLYLVSMFYRKDNRDAGFSAVTGYGYYGADYDSKYEWRGGYSLPYEEMVNHYETRWRGIAGSDTLPYILPIGSNWDSRPRAGAKAPVISGKTPEKFRVMCQNSLKYTDKRVNMAIVEAWNEWGEGSFIEPDQEWSFAFLDVLRDVFTNGAREHIDYVPSEQRLAGFSVLKGEELARAREAEKKPWPDPPFRLRSIRWKIDQPLPTTTVLKSWEFDGNTSEGWTAYQLARPQVRDGVLSTTVTKHDPQLIVDHVGIAVEDCECIALRLKLSKDPGSCQVFWSTTQAPQLSAGKSFRFRLEPDGRWHTYQVMKKPEGSWRGTLKLLRFDIGRLDDRIEADWIRIFGRERRATVK